MVLLVEVRTLRGRQQLWFLLVVLQAACGPLRWVFRAVELEVAA